MRYLSVKNFEQFQHYRDRNPPWIKLYNQLLDDYDFACLQDASKAHLIAIWLLASRNGNRIPYDSAWISSRISASDPVDLEQLMDSGFLVECGAKSPKTKRKSASKKQAKRKQNDCLEGEGETEGKQRDINNDFEEFWNLFPVGRKTKKPQALAKYTSILKSERATHQEIMDGTKIYARHHNPDFVQMPISWLNAEAWKDDPAQTTPGVGPPRPKLSPEVESQVQDLRLQAKNAMGRGDIDAFKCFHERAAKLTEGVKLDEGV